jgi:hypothetical protein
MLNNVQFHPAIDHAPPGTAERAAAYLLQHAAAVTT